VKPRIPVRHVGNARQDHPTGCEHPAELAHETLRIENTFEYVGADHHVEVPGEIHEKRVVQIRFDKFVQPNTHTIELSTSIPTTV